MLTKEKINQLLEAITKEKPSYKVLINEEEKFWQLEYRGMIDSGSLNMPENTFKRKAESVAKGGRAPSMIKIDGEIMMGA